VLTGEAGAGAGGRGQQGATLQGGSDAVGGGLGLLLVPVVRRAHRHRPPTGVAARAKGAAALLHHVGQLVGQEVLPCRAVRLVRARAEEDVAAHGEGNRRHAPVEQVGLGVTQAHHAHARVRYR